MLGESDFEDAIDAFVEERMSQERLSRAGLLRRSAAAGFGLAAGSALMGSATAFAGSQLPTSGKTIPLATLVSNAQKEGTINTITLPPTWANYGEIMSTFGKKFKLNVTDAIPDGTSAQENSAIVAQKGSKRAPDVLDVGPSFAEIGRKQGLYSPYKVSTWSTIPSNLKSPSGAWVGDYWGVIGFGVNTDVAKTVPTSWADLKNPAYANMVALGGDPRQAGEAFAAVFAASLANGGSLDDISPGIQFFADLKTAGNYITTQATSATKASGQTPIVCGWDYLQLADRDTLKGKVNITVQVPSSGVYGGYYCQAINKHAPHPYAARLWQEFLYSDAGQLLWLKGYTHPARFTDMSKRGVIPKSLIAKLPPAQDYKTVKFATVAQLATATNTLAQQWGPKVLGQ
jgi:putative spermidine/putrescine transport system substrate-binding protein